MGGLTGGRRADLGPDPGTRAAPPVLDLADGPTEIESDNSEPAEPPTVVMLPGRHHRASGTDLALASEVKHLGLELGWLSDGSVARFSRRGPLLARQTSPRASLRASTLIDALSRRDQIAIMLL